LKKSKKAKKKLGHWELNTLPAVIEKTEAERNAEIKSFIKIQADEAFGNLFGSICKPYEHNQVEEPEALTRKVLIEKTEKNVWVISDIMSQLNLNMEGTMQNILLSLALPNLYFNLGTKNNDIDLESKSS
jgi:hypothetical protein